MMVNDQDEFDQVAGVCWLATGEAESLAMYVPIRDAAHTQARVSAGYAVLSNISDVLHQHPQLRGPILPIHGRSRTAAFGY